MDRCAFITHLPLVLGVTSTSSNTMVFLTLFFEHEGIDTCACMSVYGHGPPSHLFFRLIPIRYVFLCLSTLADDLFSDPTDTHSGNGTDSLTLPSPDLSNLKDIEELIRRAHNDNMDKEALSSFIILDVSEARRRRKKHRHPLICVTLA